MTEEEVIKICKQVRKYFKGGKLAIDDTDAIYEALTMAIEALEENESLAKSLNDAAELIHKLQKKNEWIPCSERLPSAEHNLEGFLTTVRCYDENDVFIQVYENGKFGHWDGEKLIPNDDVIAWMPLPSAWKGE